MNAPLTSSAIFTFLVVLAAGCASHREALSVKSYAGNMAAMENWIAGSPTFAEFQQQVAMSQQPTFYTDMHFKKFNLGPGIVPVSMRSVTRKSPHEVVLEGAAETKAHEGVHYRIAIDEAVESK